MNVGLHMAKETSTSAPSGNYINITYVNMYAKLKELLKYFTYVRLNYVIWFKHLKYIILHLEMNC